MKIPAIERQNMISKLSSSPPNSLPATAIKLKLKTAPSIQNAAFVEALNEKNMCCSFLSEK